MRLPGTRYQEHGWEQVRKLLGAASLQVLASLRPEDLARDGAGQDCLDWYAEAMAQALHQTTRGARGRAAGNSYGDSVAELAQTLVCELRALPSFWQGFVKAVAGGGARAPEGLGGTGLRKCVNDMYASLRDRVDADSYQACTGRPCSANKMYAYRMLDTAYSELARLFAGWQANRDQVAEVLGRALDGGGVPIETRRMRSVRECRAEWIIRWSASRERFGGKPGPMHTKAKRFSSMKNNPQKIQAMLEEIGEYEALSAAGAGEGDGWRQDADDAGVWLEDYWRVLSESEQAEQAGARDRAEQSDLGGGRDCRLASGGDGGMPGLDAEPDLLDQIALGIGLQECDDAEFEALTPEERAFAEPEDELDGLAAPEAWAGLAGEPGVDTGAESDAGGAPPIAPGWPEPEGEAEPPLPRPVGEAALSLPPRFIEAASAQEDTASPVYQAMRQESLPVRLAVYLQLLGPWDESYPDEWLDPDSGELPNMKQLAGLDGISLPTLRKRRDAAVRRLSGDRMVPGAQAQAQAGGMEE